MAAISPSRGDLLVKLDLDAQKAFDEDPRILQRGMDSSARIWLGAPRFLTVVMMVLLVTSPTLASAQSPLDTTIRFETGLDPETRKVIDRFPENVKNQILDAIRQALPMIEKDIDKYLAQINDRVDEIIDRTQCDGAGLAKNIIDEFRISAGLQPAIITDLRTDWMNTVKHIGVSAPPDLYADKYGDLLYRTALTYCTANIMKGNPRVLDRETEARRKLAIWARLQHRCSDPSGCVSNVYEETAALLKTSNKADLGKAKARLDKLSRIQVEVNGTFKEVHKPIASFSDRNIPDIVVRHRLASFDPAPYEEALVTLFGIGDKLLIAKAARERVEKESQLPICLAKLEPVNWWNRGGVVKIKRDGDQRYTKWCDGYAIFTGPNQQNVAFIEYSVPPGAKWLKRP